MRSRTESLVLGKPGDEVATPLGVLRPLVTRAQPRSAFDARKRVVFLVAPFPFHDCRLGCYAKSVLSADGGWTLDGLTERG